MPQPSFTRRVVVPVFRVIVIVLAVAFALLAYGYYWLDRHVLSTLPEDLSAFREYRPPTACRVFAADGTQVDQFYVERRVWVPIDELDDTTWQAFIAAEDRRFMVHPGVDV